jgi:hypothetical protein
MGMRRLDEEEGCNASGSAAAPPPPSFLGGIFISGPDEGEVGK